MSMSEKNLPRFLPTLTEVVQAGAAASPAADSAGTSPAPVAGSPLPAADELVERVMQRLVPTLEIRLREVVTALVQEQVSALEPYLWQEVDQALRQHVTDAVAQELDALARR